MKKASGLTLIELMVTLAVAVILLAVGVPLFDNIRANNRAMTQANTFVSAVQLARSEAVGRNVPVSVCAKDSGANTCSSDWTNGWLVFYDPADGVIGSVDTKDDLIRVFDALPGTPVIVDSGDYLRFNTDGMLDDDHVTTVPYKFVIHDDKCSGKHKRTIEVSRTGQVTTVAGDCP